MFYPGSEFFKQYFPEQSPECEHKNFLAQNIFMQVNQLHLNITISLY